MTLRRLHACGVIFALVAVPAAAADAYKWLDANGRTHYADRPDAADAIPLEFAGAREPDPQRLQRDQRRDRLLDAWADERAERKAREDAERKEREAREARCEQARQVLGEYLQAAYIYDQDGDGQRRILSDAEHTEAISRARAAVAQSCRPGTGR